MGLKTMVILTLMASSGFAELPQERVNFHLKRMETHLQKSHSEARLKQVELPQMETAKPKELEGPIYDPVFYMDIPQSLKNHTSEPHSPRDPSFASEERMTNEEFIETFKQNAARKGLRLKIDPVTYEVREAK